MPLQDQSAVLLSLPAKAPAEEAAKAPSAAPPAAIPAAAPASADLGWTVKLTLTEPLLDHLERLKALKTAHPDAALALVSRCERMVQLASQGFLGELKEVCQAVIAMEHWVSPPPVWYVARMFKAAAAEGHAAVCRWMIVGGGVTPREIPLVRDAIHVVVDRTPPTLDGQPPTATLRTIELLVEHGFDVNTARKHDFWTPLHVCCQRNLTAVGLLLLDLGADVNAVAKNDVMPLTLTDRLVAAMAPRPFIDYDRLDESDGEAEEVAAEPEEPEEPEEEAPVPPLHQALLDRGARRTWRKGGGHSTFSSASLFTGTMSSSGVSGGGGSGQSGPGAGFSSFSSASLPAALRRPTGGAPAMVSSGGGGGSSSSSSGLAMVSSGGGSGGGGSSSGGPAMVLSGGGGGSGPYVEQRSDGGFNFSTGD